MMAWEPGSLASHDPVLWGPDGTPTGVEGRLVAPHALSFASVVQNVGRLYPFRWDEALRDSPQNALAMRRDAFYRRLMQERTAPTINREWEVKVPDEDDPAQKRVKDRLQQNWLDTPDRPGLVTWLMEAAWYGRSGQQVVWDRTASGQTGVVFHEPVNGDSVQFDWAGTPVVLVSYYTADRYRRSGRATSVLPPGEMKGLGFVPPEVVSATDRGAWGLKLDSPELRRRFIIHKHVREAADYFEGEMSGGVHGVGLRSWCYWSDWMKKECLSWMLGFMQSTGMMDMLIFNYPAGNEEARKAAVANAKKVSGKLTLVCPRNPKEEWPAVEQVPMNAAGVEVLLTIIRDYFDVQIEHLFVGQSMSTGGRDTQSLGGTGRADFAEDTKGHLLKTDANRLAETLTTDWLIPCRDYNFPGCKIPVRLEPVIEDEHAAEKVDGWFKAAEKGVPIPVSDVRKKLGIREPKPGEAVIGGKQGTPGLPLPGPPAPGGGGGPGTAPNPALPPGEPPPNPALPRGETPPPNSALPPGEPDLATTAPPAPNPALPPGEVAGGADAESEVRDLFSAITAAFADSDEDDDGSPLAYRGDPPWPGAVFDEHSHRWHNPALPDGGRPGAGASEPPSSAPASSSAGQAPPDDAAETLSALATAHPDVAADPGVWGRVRANLGRVREAVYGWMVRASPAALKVVEAVLDTPEDMKKFGFDPSTSGVGHAPADPLRASAGIGTHLALSIASQVLSRAVVWARRRLTGGGSPNPALPAGSPQHYAAVHAPAGGVTVGGKEFRGGEFIPGDVMAKASPAEKAAVSGGAGRATTPTPAGPEWKSHPLTKKLAGDLIRSPGLSVEQRAAYGKAAAAVLARMPRAAHDRIHAALAAATFHPDNKAVAAGAMADVLAKPGLSDAGRARAEDIRDRAAAGKIDVGGAYVPHSRTIHTDGGFPGGSGQTFSKALPVNDTAHIYAHEWAHAIDGPGNEYSSAADWQAAHAAETRGGRLTPYAESGGPSESFAEFARLVYAGSFTPDRVAKAFPRMSACFKARGLWPGQQTTTPTKSAPPTSSPGGSTSPAAGTSTASPGASLTAQPTAGRRNSPKETKPPARFATTPTGRTRIDKDVQRYTEGVNEPAVAAAVRGAPLPDNEPVDVIVPANPRNRKRWEEAAAEYRRSLDAWKAGGGKGERPRLPRLPGKVGHAIELKTMVANRDKQIHMGPEAKARKRSWRATTGVPIHTVVIDDSDVYNAHGPGRHDLSRRKVYYRRGIGSFKTAKMYEVPGGLDGVKHLLDVPTRKLPEGARPGRQRKLRPAK